MNDSIKPLKAVLDTDTPRAVDEQFKQSDELFEMINNGFKGLFQLAEKRTSFDEEKINKIVEEKLNSELNNREFIEAGDLMAELESNDVITGDIFDEKLSEHNVITTDSLQDSDIDGIIDHVIDQIELTRK